NGPAAARGDEPVGQTLAPGPAGRGRGATRVGEPATPEGLPDPSEKARVVRGMFDRISERYDLVNRVMTFGMDVGWRRRAVGELRLPGDALVADLACGTGDLCNELLASGY